MLRIGSEGDRGRRDHERNSASGLEQRDRRRIVDVRVERNRHPVERRLDGEVLDANASSACRRGGDSATCRRDGWKSFLVEESLLAADVLVDPFVPIRQTAQEEKRTGALVQVPEFAAGCRGDV